MCGIVGVLNGHGAPAEPEVVDRMTRAIAHRGPDGQGVFTDGPVGLGNRRLAILDLSHAADQPLGTEDGRFTITYNGEIFNFRELRGELEREGHRFRTRGDTEVALRAFVEWGPACVERFNGMFAFTVWDATERRLFVARDRYGIKPLYHAQVPGAVLIGSEVKSFLEHPGFRARMSAPHLLEYLTFQNIFTDGTLFEGVRMFPAGSHALVRAGEPVRPHRYWDFEFRQTATESAEELEEELDRLFRQAVERHLVSDVPVGSYLSGGIDSGSITSVAARHLPHMATFTGGFDMTSTSGLDIGPDERPKAEAMSYRFQTEHYEAVLKAGDMERCLPALVWHLEDLRVGQSYPNYYVSRLASKFVPVVLSGAGGDELFAGYPWRYYRAVVNDDFNHYVEKYYGFWHRLVPNRHMPELFAPDVWGEVADLRTIDIFHDVLTGLPGVPGTPEDYINASLYLEAKTFLHGLLMVDDKLSMAHSLEARVPFLDNDLVDFALTVPIRHKLRDLEHIVRMEEDEPGEKPERYYQKTRDGKLLLRKVLSRYVPADISDQVKRGFAGPDASWFRGDSIDYVRRVVYDDNSLIYQWLRPEMVRSLVDEHLEGRENRRLLLWSLLNLEHWCQIFLAGRIPEEPGWPRPRETARMPA